MKAYTDKEVLEFLGIEGEDEADRETDAGVLCALSKANGRTYHQVIQDVAGTFLREAWIDLEDPEDE